MRQVYDKLCYTPFTRISTLSADTKRLTLSVGSVGKDFYATGWRIGFLIGTPELIQYVVRAHTRICFVSVSPLQEAAAVGYEQAGKLEFWEKSPELTLGKLKKFCEVWDELGLPVNHHFHVSLVTTVRPDIKPLVFFSTRWLLCPSQSCKGQNPP